MRKRGIESVGFGEPREFLPTHTKTKRKKRRRKATGGQHKRYGSMQHRGNVTEKQNSLRVSQNMHAVLCALCSMCVVVVIGVVGVVKSRVKKPGERGRAKRTE